MSSPKDDGTSEDKAKGRRDSKDVSDLPPIGASLHKRRRGEPPATLSVKPQTPSDAEGSSPCTAGPSPEDSWGVKDTDCNAGLFCDNMIQSLKDKDDPLSNRGRLVAIQTKETLEAVDHLEQLLGLLHECISLEDKNSRLIKRLQMTQLRRLHLAHLNMMKENEKLKDETKEMELINEALDSQMDCVQSQDIIDSMLSSNKSMKRTTSRWKTPTRFGGSLLRRQRSRSAGGDDSDVSPGTPLRRKSDGIFCKEVEKSKVSSWRRVKEAFKWEKAQWSTTLGGAAAVAAGAMVGAVALAGSNPAGSLANPEPRDSASLTTGSALSLSPNSSCEELRIDSGVCRRSGHEHDNIFLRAPTQDDSSTSPSPNKLHKSPWVKMRDIITHRDSVKKKTKGSKSPDVLPRRRSFSDGADSDAPPALTLTIPSSEELESEGSHPVLRKQRSLELGAKAPPHRPARNSKWTRVKRAFLTSASASVPSSPNRHSAFFTDGDTEGVSSGCEAGAFRDEIARDYAALQSRLGKEFSDRRGKLSISYSQHASSRPVATEEQLSADFRKKLEEWQRMKGVRQPPPVPARQDLSDDFLKKWDDWTRMKETNSVPAWEGESKPDEVLVQTSTGLFKFKGISRSFTRKLHEWEKSRGIAPEASTSALLQAARARAKQPSAPLTRTQSDGSVAPGVSGNGRRHASSLSLDDLDSDYEREHSLECGEYSPQGRSATLVEVEAEEVCTAAPLMAVTPRHMPQTPVYTYGPAEARLLCETNSPITGTAVLQANSADSKMKSQKKHLENKSKQIHEQEKSTKAHKLKVIRQPSIEEDAKFIRKTIEEIERGSTHRYKEENIEEVRKLDKDQNLPSTSKSSNLIQQDIIKEFKESNEDKKDDRHKDLDKNNGKKKSKSRVRLEREQSKPSESDTEADVDTVTVEIPRRRKRPRRPSEKPRTPPASLHSDTEGEIFVLKIKTPDKRDVSPEVIVKTTRKIFSPVVRSGETVPTAVIPVNVEDLDEVSPSPTPQRSKSVKPSETNRQQNVEQNRKQDTENKIKDTGDIQDEEQRSNSRPPLPSSPSSQRKPSPKETAPSIRIMIQRYNSKINEEGPVSGASSGAVSPPWRSPKSERRRPPDMPVGVNIRSNPFLEREVQKSASACQLSRRERNSSEKSVPTTTLSVDGVLKSHSANALHPDHPEEPSRPDVDMRTTASTDTIVPRNYERDSPKTSRTQELPVLRQQSETIPTFSRFMADASKFDRSISVDPQITLETDALAARLSERAAKIREAREKFLFSSHMRREGTSSTSDLRPGDRCSRVSCESDAPEEQRTQQPGRALVRTASGLGRSASTGMVNVERDTWQRVAEGQRKNRPRSRFSLARLAAKIRGKEESAVSKLCRQSLLVQLRK